MAGVGLPLPARLDLENSTTLLGVLELLDQRFPEPSKASAQGLWMDCLPSSDKTVLGVTVALPIAVGSVAALNPKMVIAL